MDYQQEIESYKLLLDAERLAKDRLIRRMQKLEEERDSLAYLCELLREDTEELKWIV